MAQLLRVLVAMSDYLSSVSKTRAHGGRTEWIPASCPLTATCIYWLMGHTYTYTQFFFKKIEH